MTRLDPSLFLQRLVVTRRDHEVFNATFHRGLNIIRGENSSGKTTILEFIAFSLGADIHTWRQEALLCSSVFAEVQLNGKVATLRRDISDSSQIGMQIFWGTYEDAHRSPPTDWLSFPYRGSENKISFSQAMFTALGMPEVHGYANSRITMHQLLRLIYADQETPARRLFRREEFDSATTRQAVGDLLCGVYDDKLYGAILDLEAKNKEFAALDRQLRSIYQVLGQSGQSSGVDFVEQQLMAATLRRDELFAKLENLRKQRFDLQLTNQNAAAERKQKRYAQLVAAQTALHSAKQRLAALDAEIADSQSFIQSLTSRIQSVKDSAATSQLFSKALFSYCPACLSRIEGGPNEKCALCKTPLDESALSSQFLRMENELVLQHKESEQLFKQRQAEQETLGQEIPGVEQRVTELAKLLESESRSWSPAIDEQIEAIQRELGATEKEIENLGNSKRLADLLAQLSRDKARLNSEISSLRDEIERRDALKESRKRTAQLALSEQIKVILKMDLPRQQQFMDPSVVEVDFGADSITVDEETTFSASSQVFLNKAFHGGLLAVSCTQDYFRFPRFLILDGIEDGGMEIERSHHLQKIIHGLSIALPVEHQIIMGTSQIAADLDVPELTIGRAFTHDRKSLEIRT